MAWVLTLPAACRPSCARQSRPGSRFELLERLLRNQADVLVDIVRQVTAKIDAIEDDLLAGKLDHKRARLGVSWRSSSPSRPWRGDSHFATSASADAGQTRGTSREQARSLPDCKPTPGAADVASLGAL